jgi:hypothetical protein
MNLDIFFQGRLTGECVKFKLITDNTTSIQYKNDHSRLFLNPCFRYLKEFYFAFPERNFQNDLIFESGWVRLFRENGQLNKILEIRPIRRQF